MDAKLVLQMQCSLDGFMSGPNGELNWIFPNIDAEYTAWSVRDCLLEDRQTPRVARDAGHRR